MDMYDDLANSDEECESRHYLRLTKIPDIGSGLENGTAFHIEESEEDGQKQENSKSLFWDDSLIGGLSLASGINDSEKDNESGLSGDELEPFEKLALSMEDITGDSGVLKQMVTPGVGTDLPKFATVLYHYNAYLEHADEPFDSTILRHKPARSQLDDGKILLGLNIALKTMRVKEKSRFLVKPAYAFGKIGCPPRIPPNATVLYEVTILKMYDYGAAVVFESLDAESRYKITFSEKFNAARAYHRQGNDCYRDEHLQMAKKSYYQAVNILNSATLNNDEETAAWSHLLLKLHSNLAQVFMDLDRPARVCVHCQSAIDIPGKLDRNILAKVYYRYGKAKSLLGSFGEARKFLVKAQNLYPNNPEVIKELRLLLEKQQKYEEQEKVIYGRMFPAQQWSTPSEGGSAVDKTGRSVGEELGTKPATINLVSPEFEKLVEEEISSFMSDTCRHELPFPPNLSANEIAFISAAAKAAKCKITVNFAEGLHNLRIVKT